MAPRRRAASPSKLTVLALCLGLTATLAARPGLGQHAGQLGKPPPGAKPPRLGQPLPRWPQRADPAPLTTLLHLDIAVSLKQGRITVESVTKGAFAKPTPIPRFRGRFVVKLYAQALLRDLVRFDLPLTGGTDEKDSLGLGLSKGVAARAKVRVPFDSTISRALILDTLTSKTCPVPLGSVLPPPPASILPGAPSKPGPSSDPLGASQLLVDPPPKAKVAPGAKQPAGAKLAPKAKATAGKPAP